MKIPGWKGEGHFQELKGNSVSRVASKGNVLVGWVPRCPQRTPRLFGKSTLKETQQATRTLDIQASIQETTTAF